MPEALSLIATTSPSVIWWWIGITVIAAIGAVFLLVVMGGTR